MFLRFCRRAVYPRIDSREACRGSNVILGLALIGGIVTGLAMLISRLSAAI
jgi:hypothetical protein